MKRHLIHLVIAFELICFMARNCHAEECTAKEWSILICTLNEREVQFKRLYENLSKQIKDNHLEDKIEILSHKDNREISIGEKRNALMQRSQGLYVNFIDDDDRVHPEYIKMIYDRLKSRPDCVSLVGIITINHENSKLFIHSIKYQVYSETDTAYYRPPNHLNTMKRSIAAQFRFPTSYFGEDYDWAMQIARSGLLKVEAVVHVPYYFYDYIEKK